MANALFSLFVFHCVFVSIVPNHISAETRAQNFDIISSFVNQRLSPFAWQSQNWTTHISPRCRDSLVVVSERMVNGDPEAYRFLDSSGSVPSGLLDGTLISTGDYDQCLNIGRKSPNGDLKGKYCLVEFMPSSEPKDVTPTIQNLRNSISLFDTYSLSMAICIPSSCSESDIRTLFQEHFQSPVIQLSKEPLYCDTIESKTPSFDKMRFSQILSIILLSSTIGLIWMITAIHLTFPKLFEKLPGASHLSLIQNWKETIRPASQARHSNIDMVRVFFALYVAHCHSLACATEFRAFKKIQRLNVDFYDKFTWFFLQPGFNVVGIEAFFFISGIMAGLTNRLKGNVTLSTILKTIAFRWLRLAPSIIFLMVVDFVWPLFGDGPMYTELTSYIYKNCEKNWWKNIIFISNWDETKDVCLSHVWYISAEFQLFVMGVFALALLQLHQKLGVLFCSLMMLAGMIIPGIKTWVYGISPAALVRDHFFENANAFFNTMYFPTHCHFTPFFLGILIGYAMQTKLISLDSLRQHRIIGFFLICGFWVVSHFPAIWNTYNYPVNRHIGGLYATFHRLIWTLGFFAGTIFLRDILLFSQKFIYPEKKKQNNINNNNNQIEVDDKSQNGSQVFNGLPWMLAPIQIMGKLYFSLFLIHSSFIRFNWFTSRTLFVFDVQANNLRGMYSVAASLGCAFFFHLYFERPFENIRHALKAKYQSSSKKVE